MNILKNYIKKLESFRIDCRIRFCVRNLLNLIKTLEEDLVFCKIIPFWLLNLWNNFSNIEKPKLIYFPEYLFRFRFLHSESRGVLSF